MNTITHIEDLLPPQTFDYVSAKLTDIGIHWYYLPFTANPSDLEGLAEYQGSFSHLIFKDNEAISPLWDSVLMVLFAALEQTGEQLDSVIRVRLGLNTRTPYPVEHTPHVDHPVMKHRVGIFYPADSNGDTVIFNERHLQRRREDYTEWHRQQPRANTWIGFDGAHYHASTTPTEFETRYVLNINYTVK